MPVIPAIAKPNNLLKDNFVCVESMLKTTIYS